ncbi:T9SS type A sorting domain-containing protein [Roseivirga sp. BDSF3-8]|uniref:T9SS type A sorting domain-containing protein n=1 Tax=Roseivirga sp. BDSF3-8 TaxID=3241598 RepID=UPI003531AA36
MKHIFYGLWGMMALWLLTLSGYAQSGGGITFRVNDEFTGFRLKQATIRVWQGKQLIEELPAPYGTATFSGSEGAYDFTIVAPGHEEMRTHFTLRGEESINADIQMSRPEGEGKPGREVNERRSAREREVTMVEGFVRDEDTGNPLWGVKVNLKGGVATTDESGYFKLETVPGKRNENGLPDETEILLTKPGYRGYRIADFRPFAEAFIFKIGMNKAGREDNGRVMDSRSDKIGIELDHEGNMGKTTDQQAYEERQQRKMDEITANSNGRIYFQAPPSSIRIGTGCSCRTSCSNVVVYSLEDYVGSGVNDEWYPSWTPNSHRAGAVAYRTYGAYHVYNPVATNWDIVNNTCRQAWDSDVAQSTVDAAAYTAGIMVEKNNSFFFAEYSSENNNSGCGNGYAGTGSSWPCIYDPLCSGRASFGHGRGMCQFGTQFWSQDGKDFAWICNHYYNPGSAYLTGPIEIQSGSLSASTVAPGSSTTITYNLRNYSTLQPRIMLGASIAGIGGDAANDKKVSVPNGTSSHSRSFRVPSGASQGTYDLQLSLWFDVNGDNAITSVDFQIENYILTDGITVGQPDNTAPVATISTSSTSVTSNFSVTFTDSDAGTITDRFYQVLEWREEAWRANRGNGFYNDNFGDESIFSDYTIGAANDPNSDWRGSWSETATGRLYQSDATPTNTGLTTFLSQTALAPYLYHFASRMVSTSGPQKFGMHIMSSSNTHRERGKGYLVWFNLSTQEVLIYKTNDVAPELTFVKKEGINVATGQWVDYKIIYDPISGVLRVYINNKFALTWTDPSPISSGNYISLRTGEAGVEFDDLKVYKSRSAGNRTVTVSSFACGQYGGDARFPSPDGVSASCKVKSLAKDAADNWSSPGNLDMTVNPVNNCRMDGEGTKARIEALIVPNPSGGEEVDLMFSVGKEGKVSVALYDLSGKRKEMILEKHLAAGDYKQDLSKAVSKLSPGAYLIRIEQEGEAEDKVVRLIRK